MHGVAPGSFDRGEDAPFCGDNLAPADFQFRVSLFNHSPAMSSTPHYEVRLATLNDAQAVADIHAGASRAAYQGLVPDEHLGGLPAGKRLSLWREAIEYGDPQVLVALEGGKVVGFTGFDRSRDKGTPATMGEIWAIYAAPTHWDRGVGLALWDGAREGLLEEGCTHVTVWIPLRNERALRFFELAGFKREMSSAKTAVMGTIKLEEVRLKRALT